MTFQLHPQLKKDSIKIGCFSLSQLLLINDSQYPWFVLVPKRINLTEIYQLSEQEQTLLQQESSFLASTLASCFKADKMNIAVIGNLVPQLHIHHIVRYKNDIAWPAPVWGKYDAVPYTKQQVKKIQIQVTDALATKLIN
jgi:diadenosine tetraphosphate (Ap4A) HIT family hydrolase